MKNPRTGKPLTKRQAARIEALRTIRRNATKAARSGNPAKREPARRVLAQIPAYLHHAYTTQL